MDDVLQELIFGMENINISSFEMRKRLAELVHFFGVEHLIHKKTTNLSGGQKQMINLLAVLLLRPNIILLDEPTSQLDPVATKELTQMLIRLNVEMGMTIIIAEHRLEELFTASDKVIMLNDGNIAYNGANKQVVGEIYHNNDELFLPYIPSVSQLYLAKEQQPKTNDIPLNVKETRNWLQSKQYVVKHNNVQLENKNNKSEMILALENIHFQYEKHLPFVLNNCSVQLRKGELFSLVGSNGSGKTTLLRLCMGVLKQQRGKIIFKNKKLNKYKSHELVEHFAYLPQHPLSFYLENTIESEMKAIIQKHNIKDGLKRLERLVKCLQLTHLLSRHPNDLSGGELQKATIACLLLKQPTVLFIDEPTKGLDPISKNELANILKELQ